MSHNNHHHNKKVEIVAPPDNIELNEHMKAMWAGQSNVLVAVRVRPLMKHDQIKKSCARTLDSKVVVIMDPAQGDKQDILRANRSREKQYAFDFVFDPVCSQDNIYNNTTKFLIHGVLDGYNATVFAYGQTGSGKTHTMIGSQTDPGIMVRVMEDLFIHSKVQGKHQGVQYKVTVSFLEVYNENIRDLLSDVEEYLDLREDPIKGPVVASITEIEATSSQEIMQLLHQGNAKRSQAATAANEVSSRSHAVLQVVVECRDRAPGTVANIKVGKLSLVDLAGSERAANTKNVGVRLVEGANINRSLLALGNCINALGEKGNKGNFVPYRDSKLTRLLKDSLGGNCRTVMIATISSAESSFEETLNTLKYANRAKNIKTNVQRNVLNVNYHISEYVELINNLRSEIQVLKGQISTNNPAENNRVGTSHIFRESVSGSNILAAGGAGHGGNIAANAALHIHPPAPDQGLGLQLSSPLLRAPSRHNKEPSTPFQALRESLRSATQGGVNGGGEGREFVNNMRQKIVENFQERMQLRRSLIELEDQNVQNSIEVSKRQLIVVHWSEKHGNFFPSEGEDPNLTKADFTGLIMSNGSPEIVEAWQECEQLRKAIIKNNGMKKNIAKRLRYNEKEAEKFREELSNNITGEDRRELMALQYQVGRLELENMELEQHRIVHESILKGKDLIIQKLKLQLAVRDKVINRQQVVLREHHLDNKVGYEQLAFMEESILNTTADNSSNAKALGVVTDHLPSQGHILTMTPYAPPSPPRNMSDLLADKALHHQGNKQQPRGSKQQPESKFSGDEYSEDEEHYNHHGNNKHGNNNNNKKGGIAAVDAVSPSKLMVPKLKIKEKGSSNKKKPLLKHDNSNRKGGLSNSHISEGEIGDNEDNMIMDPDQDDVDDVMVDHQDDDQDEYDEDLAFTEREVALTSRDRDLIEQGDWSEIQSELSDHSFTFGSDSKPQHGNKGGNNNRGNNGGNKKQNSSSKAQKAGSNNSKAAAGSKIAPPANNSVLNTPSSVSNNVKNDPSSGNNSGNKGVHGPRGGRIYRSSLGEESSNSARPLNTNPVGNKGKEDESKSERYDSNPKAAGNFNRKGGVHNNADDLSDDDSINQKFQSKYKHYHSPRTNNNNSNVGGSNNNRNNGSLEKFEHIPAINGNNNNNPNYGVEEGILSGRKYDKDTHFSMAPLSSKDVSPRIINSNNNNNNVDNSNYAVIYPSLTSNQNSGSKGQIANNNNGSKERYDKERDSGNMKGNNNMDFAPIVSSIRNNISNLKQRDDSVSRLNNKASLPGGDDESEALANDVDGLVIKSKGLGKPLGKIKSKVAGAGLLNNNESAGLLNPIGNKGGVGSNVASNAELPTSSSLDNNIAPNDLNILGNGYEGLGAVGGSKLAAGGGRPKIAVRQGKLASQKSGISASPSAQDISTPFDGGDAGNLGVEISGMKIMKSLPVLNKQAGNLPPDSARGEAHK